jgi:hypothetical protein
LTRRRCIGESSSTPSSRTTTIIRRNHAVVAASTDWRLAPAFDLTPNPQMGWHERDLALVCGRFGTRATRQNLISAAPRFGLTTDDASTVIDRMSRSCDGTGARTSSRREERKTIANGSRPRSFTQASSTKLPCRTVGFPSF